MITALVDKKRAQLKGLLLVRLQIQSAELHTPAGTRLYCPWSSLPAHAPHADRAAEPAAPGQKVLASWKV